MDRAVGGRRATRAGAAPPKEGHACRAAALIAARSVTAMPQDQARYGTTPIAIGPRADGPLNFSHEHTPWAFKGQRARPGFGHGQE